MCSRSIAKERRSIGTWADFRATTRPCRRPPARSDAHAAVDLSRRIRQATLSAIPRRADRFSCARSRTSSGSPCPRTPPPDSRRACADGIVVSHSWREAVSGSPNGSSWRDHQLRRGPLRRLEPAPWRRVRLGHHRGDGRSLTNPTDNNFLRRVLRHRGAARANPARRPEPVPRPRPGQGSRPPTRSDRPPPRPRRVWRHAGGDGDAGRAIHQHARLRRPGCSRWRLTTPIVNHPVRPAATLLSSRQRGGTKCAIPAASLHAGMHP